jgi:high-affinity iron transporter
VLAYLVRSGNGQQAGKVWLGTGAAVVASLIAGLVIFRTVGSLQSPYEQLFEAATLLIASTVVTWMLFWMRRQSAGLRGALHAKLERVLTEETVFGLAILAFTAVIREGLETSLFLVGQATAAEAGAGSVLLGAVLGLVAAAAIGWVFYTGSRRIDLRSFFRWTGIGLVFLAAGLVSRGVHELVEIRVIPIGSQTVFNLSGVLPDDQGIGQFLRAILGYSSTPEAATLIVYVAYLVVVLGLYLRPMHPPAAPARPAESTPGAAEGVRT